MKQGSRYDFLDFIFSSSFNEFHKFIVKIEGAASDLAINLDGEVQKSLEKIILCGSLSTQCQIIGRIS